MSRSLQDKLRKAREPNVGCVLILTDGSEVACSHIETPGSSAGGSGIVKIVCWDETEKSFGIEEIADVRLVEDPPSDTAS